MSNPPKYLYSVSIEKYDGAKFLGTGRRQVVATHCAIAAKMVEQEAGVYATDAKRVEEVKQ